MKDREKVQKESIPARTEGTSQPVEAGRGACGEEPARGLRRGSP